MIPNDAVEAAARALAERNKCPEEWQFYLSEARSALEAAAPHLMRAAWDEGADSEFQRSVMKRQRDGNPYAVMGKQ